MKRVALLLVLAGCGGREPRGPDELPSPETCAALGPDACELAEGCRPHYGIRCPRDGCRGDELEPVTLVGCRVDAPCPAVVTQGAKPGSYDCYRFPDGCVPYAWGNCPIID